MYFNYTIACLLLITLLNSCDTKTTTNTTTQTEVSQPSLNAQEQQVDLNKNSITSSALQVGDKAPDFTLTNAVGEQVNLYEELKSGKVILTWYRGNWCPYCNSALHELQLELPNLKQQGAQLIALSPELPDESISTKEKHSLEFEVLSDVGNKVGKQYGIVFQLEDATAKKYNEAIQLNEHNGDQSNELPIPATYIINEEGTIIYAFLNEDYTKRANPKDLVEFLKHN